MAPPVVQEEVPWYLEDATPEWLKRIEELTKAKLKKDAEDLVNALIAKFDKLFTDSPWLVRGMKFRILELPQGFSEVRDLIYHCCLDKDNWNRSNSTIETFGQAAHLTNSFYTPSLFLFNKQIAQEAALALRKIPYVVHDSMYDRFVTPRFDNVPTNGYKNMRHLQHVKLVFVKGVDVYNVWHYTYLLLAISQPLSELKSLIVVTKCCSRFAQTYGEEAGWKFGPTAKNRIHELLYPSKAQVKSISDLNVKSSVDLLLNAIAQEESEAKGEASGMEKWDGPKNPLRPTVSKWEVRLPRLMRAIRSDLELLPDVV